VHNRHPRAYRTLSNDQLASARDERRLPDLHPRNIGDGIEGTRCSADLCGKAKIARAGLGCRGRRLCPELRREPEKRECKKSGAHEGSPKMARQN
jgi:hypothetical protein